MANEEKVEVKEEVVVEEAKTEETVEAAEETSKPKKESRNKYKEENIKLKEEIAELKNDLLRNRADLENFKKRTKEEMIKDRKFASLNLVSDLIVPLEYLTRAFEFQTQNA